MNINNKKIESYYELSEEVKNWTSFNFSGVGNYDFIGMLELFQGVLNNLEKHSIEHDFEDLEDFFEESEILFLKKILKLVENK